jgi:autoinducer 2-degrading protein
MSAPAPAPINLIVTVDIAAADTDEFLRVMKVDCEGSRLEPGCLAFDVLQDASVPTRYYFYESYADAGALAFHAQQPHFAAWAAFKEARGVVSMSKVRATSLF